MKLSNSGRLLAILSGSALALLPVANSLAEPPASPAGNCAKGNCDRSANAAQRTYLGVLVQPITPALAEAFGLKENRGALVAEVMPGSPAAKAGLKQGDVIIAISGKEIADGAALQKHIAAQESGTKIDIEYLRGTDNKTVQAELAGPAKSRTAAVDRDGIFGGLNVADVSDRLRQKFNLPENITGVVVTSVEDDSAAERAGLRAGDVIQQIDRQDVQDAREAAALSDKLEAKDKVLVLVWSKGASRFTVLEQNA